MAALSGGLVASLLEIERDRLLCSLQHLERSVVELKQAQAEDPDPEYKAAISEDLVVIAKQRARVAALEDEIKRARGVKADISHAQVAAVPVSDTASADQQHSAAGGARPPQQRDAGESAMDLDSHGATAAAAAGNQQQQQQQQQRQQQQAAAGGGSSAEGVWL